MESERLLALRIRRWIGRVCIAVSLFCAAAPWTTGAASFTVSLEPETVAVGDSALLKLTFQGDGQVQLSQVPPTPGVVWSGRQQSTSYREENGVRSQALTISWSLRPERLGDFEIPPFTASIGGEQFTSRTLRLKAVKAAEPALQGGLAALRIVVPRDRLFVGESMVVEGQLLLNQNVRGVSDFNMPDFSGEGWLTGEAFQGRTRKALCRSQVVQVVPFRFPVTPLSPGTLSLGPAETAVVVEVPAPGSAGRPSIFQRTQRQRVALTMPAQTIEVLPLPDTDIPAGFGGAVGQFEMRVNAGPTNLTVGDPITLRVDVEGSGNLSSMVFPDSLVTGDFKTYEPEIRLETTDDFGLVGVKTVEQIVIPESTEVTELPPIAFSYFDPERQAYRTLEHPATPLTVMPAGSLPMPLLTQDPDATSGPADRDDIVHIKHRLGPAHTVARPSGIPTGFYAWNGVPLLAWLGTLVWRKRREVRLRNPRLQRELEIHRALEDGFRRLEEYSHAGDSEAFFSTLFRMLQDRISLTLDQPASGITEIVVDEKLAPMGLSEETRQVLSELFQACDAARYAPVEDRQELAAIIPRLRTALSGLEDIEE